MSGKKPKTIPGWFNCSKCKKKFAKQFMTKHCGEDENPCRPVYPYQKNDELHCLLMNVTSSTKKIGDIPFIKDKRIASGTIFLSEDLIKECGLTTFGWISLSSINACDFSCTDDDDAKTLNDSVVDVVEAKKDIDFPSSDYAFRVWPIPESIGSNQCNLTVVLSAEGFRINKLLPSSSKQNISGDAPVGLVSLKNLTSSVGKAKEIFPCVAEVTLVIENMNEIDSDSFDQNRFISSFRQLFEERPIAVDNRFKIRFYAQFVNFYIGKVVSSNQPMDTSVTDLSEQLNKVSLDDNKNVFYQIIPKTVVNVITKENSLLTNDANSFKYHASLKDIGGLGSIVKEICSTIKFILNTDLEDVPKGILLYGHIGVGKSLLVEAVSNEFKLFQIHYEEFKSIGTFHVKNTTSSRSSSLEKIFKDAINRTPSVIIVDGLDVFAPIKSSGGTSPSQFAFNFSRLASSSQFRRAKSIILCTATNLEKVDPNLRTSKIFAKEIEIPVPSASQRKDILVKILSKVKHSLTDDNISSIASATHGFVAADLRSLCNQASLDAISKQSKSSSPVISVENLYECVKLVKPSAIKTILIDVPNVKWADIGGQDELKFKLKQAIEWPLKHPESFKRLGINPPKGVLMYGPPGCSKTMIAKAIATESGLNFISVKGSELFSKWVGESEKAVQAIFRKARQVAPCVVFFDEIDSLGGERGTSSGSSNVHERVLAQILVEIDGIEALKDVTIVAATNRPDRIDKALLRPGRLDRIIYVPLPEGDTRREIFRIRFRKMPVDSEVNIDQLVDATEGYSGAEITAVCHEAALKSLEEDITSCTIRQSHFEEALNIIKPRTTQEQIKFYKKYSTDSKCV